MYRENIDKLELAELPLIQFEGKISMIESKEEYLDSIEYLSQQSLLGFDTETKPAFKKGEFNEVALLQLATKDRAFLFRLNRIGFGNALKSIPVSYTHLRAHETRHDLVCRLLLEK